MIYNSRMSAEEIIKNSVKDAKIQREKKEGKT